MSRIQKGLILFLTAIIFLFNLGRPARTMEATEALEEILEFAGARAARGEIRYYAGLENRFLSTEELEKILREVASCLGLEETVVSASEGETFRVLDTTGVTAQGSDVHIIVQSNPQDGASSAETYLLVVLCDTSLDSLKSAANGLKKSLNRVAPGGLFSCYLTGEIPEKLSPLQMSKLAASALASVDGRIVEGMENDELVSYTAYSPRISDHVDLGDKRFNLNVAVRYDNHLKKTVFWVGFPLIHASY